MKKWIDYGIKYKKPFFLLLGVYLLAFSAIFRANYSYVDDLGRACEGYHGWLDWSRWTTEILATLIHGEWYLTDISPLPQLIACVIMAIGGILLLIPFQSRQNINFFHIAALTLTGLAPYFLGIISYKFDSPYMALSFLASVVPFLVRDRLDRHYSILSVICLLIMCTTYQASSGIYPLIVLFLAAKDVCEGEKFRKVFKFVGISALCYVVALAAFWLLLMRENGVSVPDVGKLVPYSVNRYIIYYNMIFQDFNKIWLALIAILVLLFLYGMCRTAEIHKSAALAVGIFTVTVGSFLCFGAYLFISEDAYDTRSMYGFNVYLTLIAVLVSCCLNSRILKMIYVVLAWCFLVFSLTYGNALVQQQRFLDYRMGLLCADLNGLETMNTDELKTIRFAGDIGVSPAIANMAETYPLMNKIIFTGMGAEYWGGYYFYHYLDMPNIELTYDENKCNDLPVIKDTMYHTIRGDASNILIELW